MKIIKSANKVIGIIFQDDVVMSDTVSGDYASHIEAPEESIPLSVADYIASVLQSNSQWDRFGKITVDNMSANLSLEDMAEHLIRILIDNMQPDPEVLAEAVWDLFMPVPFPSVEGVDEIDYEFVEDDNLFSEGQPQDYDIRAILKAIEEEYGIESGELDRFVNDEDE